MKLSHKVCLTAWEKAWTLSQTKEKKCLMHLRGSSGKSMDPCWLMDRCQIGIITKFKNYSKTGWYTRQEQNLEREKSIHVFRNKEANNIYIILSESKYKFLFPYNTARYVLYKAAVILWCLKTSHLHYSEHYETLPVKRRVEYFLS